MLPTLKEKTRYLVYGTNSTNSLGKSEVEETMKNALFKLTGSIGLAKAGIQFLPDWKNNKGIMRISHNSVTEMKAAFSLIEKVKNTKATIQSRGVSGVLKKARSRFL